MRRAKKTGTDGTFLRSGDVLGEVTYDLRPHMPDVGGTRDGSFERFYMDTYASSVRLAMTLTGSNLVSEDLVQEAYIDVEGHFDGLDRPFAYLRRAVVRRCASWHRRNARRNTISAGTYLNPPLESSHEELFDILSRLPYRQRAALTLRFWCDMDVGSIADALGCRPGTVKSSISRGLDRLRNDLKEEQ
jgi:RNA polymerase sigma factor (sigma-70 family)